MKKTNACFALLVLLWASMAYAQVASSGTRDYIPLWTGGTALGNSAIFQSGERIGIGTKAPGAKFNVVSTSTSAPAITGNANATSGYAPGVYGTSASSTTYAAAVYGHATATTGGAFGVYGQSESPNGTAVQGYAASASAGATNGVAGFTNNGGNGVIGGAYAPTGFNFGVQGFSLSSGGVGVQGGSPNVGVVGINQVCSPTCNLVAGTAGQFITGSGGLVLQGLAGSNYAQVFSVDSNGNLSITGNLSKGSGSFKIDHPLDPANKYLEHSFVESPDMMNIYNGVIVLDSKGEAYVTLPDYFQALNSDFRYQLTAMGTPGPNLYVAEEISGNHFKVSGGKPGGKVSWQVTGVRQDAYAKAHRIRVEEDKPAQEKGHYLHPELFGASEEEAIGATRPPAVTLPATEANTSQANLR
jgi:trimeric autotransporter adhesin